MRRSVLIAHLLKLKLGGGRAARKCNEWNSRPRHSHHDGSMLLCLCRCIIYCLQWMTNKVSMESQEMLYSSFWKSILVTCDDLFTLAEGEMVCSLSLFHGYIPKIPCWTRSKYFLLSRILVILYDYCDLIIKLFIFYFDCPLNFFFLFIKVRYNLFFYNYSFEPWVLQNERSLDIRRC